MANQTHAQQRLQLLYQKVKLMRTNQNRYFKLGKDDPNKKASFEESKKNEADLDGFIKIIEYEQVVDTVNF